MKPILAAATILSLSAFGAGSALADHDHDDDCDSGELAPHYHGPAAYDQNQDGVLEHSERDWMRFDRDRDGRLDRWERRAYERHLRRMRRDTTERRVNRRARRLLRRYDRNRDGFLSRWEARRAPLQLWRADFNRDGFVGRRELRAYLAGRRAEAPRQRRRRVTFPWAFGSSW